jgi:hypothetical protein
VHGKKTCGAGRTIPDDGRLWTDLRPFVRLSGAARSLEYRRSPGIPDALTTTAQRFVQQINGRDYRIEVTQLGVHRWRAQVLNAYGGPTALMPFYDATPDEAVTRLSEWLSLAHRSAATSTT